MSSDLSPPVCSNGSTGNIADASGAEVIINAAALSKVYAEGRRQTVILNQINLSIKRGDMIAICGASGSGKSTLLHLLGGLDKPTSGTVSVMQHDIWQLTETERCKLRNTHLGFIYQFHHLLPEFNALENVMMPLFIAGIKRGEAKQRAVAILQKVKLGGHITQHVGEMSGGERQRVAIARALVTEPACVLADEPTGNLDQDTAHSVFDLMLELNQQLAISFVMVTHNQALAQQMSHQFYLNNGVLHPGINES